MNSKALTVRPIGRVSGDRIELHRRWLKALDGIQGFSHLIVIFWLDRARAPELRIHPKGIKAVPKLGLLATRTPHRFNPIGFTVVRLIGKRGTVLRVEGLDAWDDTPILDIKPYTAKDAVKKIRMPGWVKLLDRRETDPLRRYGA